MMPLHRARVDTLELKSDIVRRLGRRNADSYFSLLSKFFSLRVRKREFDRLCLSVLGKENVGLHNRLIRSIIRNACLPVKVKNQTEDPVKAKFSNGISVGRDIPRSPQKEWTPNSRDHDCEGQPVAIFGPQGKDLGVKNGYAMDKLQQQESVTELLSAGSRPPSSEEDSGDVIQSIGSSSSCSWRPIIAPIGVPFPNPINTRSGRAKVLLDELGDLPSTSTLRNIMEQRLEGLQVSMDSAHLLNHGLDTFLKGLIRPCLAMASLRSQNNCKGQESCSISVGQNNDDPRRFISASMIDFQVMSESNPLLLGQSSPIQLEKVCLLASEGTVYQTELSAI